MRTLCDASHGVACACISGVFFYLVAATSLTSSTHEATKVLVDDYTNRLVTATDLLCIEGFLLFSQGDKSHKQYTRGDQALVDDYTNRLVTDIDLLSIGGFLLFSHRDKSHEQYTRGDWTV